MFDCWIKISKNGEIKSKSVGRWICDSCGDSFERLKKNHDAAKKRSVYNGMDICRKCVNKFVNNTDEYKRKQRESQLKLYESDPDRRIRISNTMLTNKVNFGEKNGMKKLDARKKVSESRKNMSVENRKIYSDAQRKAWADGKFADVKVGRCKWYAINTPNGPMKVQGTWELKYAEYLMENNIPFYAHRGRITYVDSTGILHSYYPDFYLPDEDRYVDIKAPYIYGMTTEKFELIRKQYPNLKLDIISYKKTLNAWEYL